MARITLRQLLDHAADYAPFDVMRKSQSATVLTTSEASASSFDGIDLGRPEGVVVDVPQRHRHDFSRAVDGDVSDPGSRHHQLRMSASASCGHPVV